MTDPAQKDHGADYDQVLNRGSFATGSEHITRMVYVCSEHGRVKQNEVGVSQGGRNFHTLCGKSVKRVRVPNFPGDTIL